MPTKSKYKNGILEFYDSTTQERVAPFAPVLFYDDFLSANTVVPAAGSSESGMHWVKKIVGSAPPTVAGVADGANGIVACTLTSASEKQDAALYFDDQRNFVLTQGCVFEARVKLAVLPTSNAELVWGLVGDWADGADAITYSAFFTADGSGEVICEMDDNATDASATSGVTLTANDWAVCRIDFSDINNVLFFINGNHVATSTTFAYAATGANATLQPFFQAYKASGTGVGTLQVDYVRVWQKRS
jgi:hypothetical protein